MVISISALLKMYVVVNEFFMKIKIFWMADI